MSLLWHDGFGSYQTLNSQFLISYPSLSPSPAWNPHVPGRQAGAFAMRFDQAGVNWFQTPALQTFAGAGTDVCILGFAARFDSHPAAGSGLISLYAGSTEQIRLRYQQLGARYFFTVERVSSGVPDKILATTPSYQLGKWRFHELRVVFAQSEGIVEWRTDGTYERSIQAVRTEGTVGFNRGWDRVRVGNQGSTGTYLTDLYVLNELDPIAQPEFARFLGDSVSLALFPDFARGNGRASDWVHNPRALVGSDKIRLVVISGQSNSNGQSLYAPLPLNPGIQSPNPSIAIWDRVSGSPAFRPLEAGVNNNNHYLLPVGAFQGPEMAFASTLADYYAQMSGVPQPTGVVLIKGAQGGSSVYPNLPDFTWDFNTPGNLWNDLNGIAAARGCLLQDIVDAVAALGGWGRIEKIDFFWHQGETDAIFDFSAQQYGFRLNSLFDRVRADLPLVPIVFHLVQLHKDLRPASAPNQLDGFWFRDTVRGWHQLLAHLRSDTKLINVDAIPLAADLTHYTNTGYDKVGVLYFDNWLSAQSVPGEIDDLTTGPQDDDATWLGIKSHPRDVLVKLTPTVLARGTRVRRVRASLTGKSDSTAIGAKMLVDNAAVRGEGEEQLTFPSGVYVRQSTLMAKNPATGRGFSENELHDHQFGFRSSV